MNRILSKHCRIIERNDKVLLFNTHNLEIALMSKRKYGGNWNDEEKNLMLDLGMLANVEDDDCSDDSYIKNMETPDHIAKAYLLFGTDCNISCRYCTVKYNAESNRCSNVMSDSTFRNSMKLLFNKSSIEHITLYGGEPLLHKERISEFLDFIENIPDEEKPDLDIITNGIITDNDLIERFKKNNVLVIISLDGFKSQHDMFRTYDNGNGTYDQVCKGIDIYKDSGVRVGISMVIGKHNYKSLHEVCKELKRKYDIVSIGMSLPHLEPKVVTDDDFYAFIHDNYSSILDTCQELNLWFEQGMKRIHALANKQYYVYGCPVTNKGAMIRILPNGEITLCENMGLRGYFLLGNVNHNNNSLESIMDNPTFKAWYNRRTETKEKCRECIAFAVCGMGCPYDAYLEHGSIFQIESRGCSISMQAINWYLNRITDQIEISNLDSIKVLNSDERNGVIVNCPWEKK